MADIKRLEGLGAPLLEGSAAWLECRLLPEPATQQTYDLFLGEVVAAHADSRVFSNGRWHFEGHDALRTIHHVAGGHFLVLDFSAPRVRRQEYADLAPRLAFTAAGERWTSTILVPWAMVPAGLKAVNGFVIVRDHLLAHHPTPGATPDFHQPSTFPAISL